VKVDRTPPETVAFEAPDPADPRRVRVVVADRTSGVAAGRIELRRTGSAWRALKTAFVDGRLVTLIDDAALEAGAYELRARVTDVAGNEAVGTSRVDGAPATLTLPLRRRASLVVSRTGKVLRARLSAGAQPLAGRELTLAQRLRGRTTWRRMCARRTVVIARAAVAPSRAAALARAAAYGLAGGSPAATAGLAGASTAAAGVAAATPDSAPGCALRSDRNGRVEVRLRRGPSRTMRVAFAGDALLLPASARATIRTAARVRLRAMPPAVRAGGAVRFSGRLLGGHLPPAGKLVEVQARVRAGWRTFATVRSHRRGRVRHTHRFAPASAGRTFWIRLRVRRESAYPFETGSSRPVAVRVI
jgi:hypothetical protein